MARSTVAVRFTGDTASLGRSLGQIDSKMGRIGRTASGMAKLVGGAFAVREIIQFGGALVDAAEESQKVTRQTAAVIKSMGNAANVAAEEVADLATELSLKSGIDDELIQSGSNVLLTFRNIRNEVGKGNDIFDQANELTLDLSVALGKDLTSSATMVGKALNDPIAGLTALARVGVQFTEQQKDQIKAMVEVGDLAGAQKLILAELSAQFSGSAEAQATASAKLSVAWDNLKEQLGEKLLPVVERFTTWLTNNLPAAMERAQAIGERLSQFYRDHEGLVQALAIAVGTVLVGAMVAYAASAASAAVATIAATWPILAIIAAIALLTAGVIYAYQNWGWFRDAVDKSIGSFKIIQKVIRQLNDGLSRFVDLAKAALKGMQSLINLAPDLPSIGGASGGLQMGPWTLPIFDSGGVMPGPRGKHSLAMVAGGETILPTHKRGGGMAQPEVIQLVVDGRVLAEVMRNHDRSLR